jgi:hypothetical protein
MRLFPSGSHSQPRSSTCRIAAMLALAAVAGSASAQAFQTVSYGDCAVQGALTIANQTDTFVLGSAPLVPCNQGDLLRITFSSASSGYPSYVRHTLEVLNNAASIGTIQGEGVLTVQLPSTALYRITVHAQNSSWTGWYAFQVDRLNNPVGADRIAFNWNVNGHRCRNAGGTSVNVVGISAAAQFAVYTLHAEAGNSAMLSLSASNSGFPSYTSLYAELLDPTGTATSPPLARADGVQSVAIGPFPATGIYTLFVAAQDRTYSGTYHVSLICQTLPSCDGQAPGTAYTANYGAGWPGSNQAVPSLTATQPVLGSMLGITIGNSYGQPAPALLLFGLSADYGPAPAFGAGATVLVSGPAVLDLSPLAAGGTTLYYQIPADPFLAGIGVALQAVVADPNQPTPPYGAAFSRGLLLLLGH